MPYAGEVAVRLGVLDVGSNTVHLLGVDAHEGARPLPAHSDKSELRLAEHLTDDGMIDDSGQQRLLDCVRHALDVAEDRGAEDLLAFATSAVREAGNGPALLQRVRDETGVDLQVLTGDDEARLTFLAVRRWFGWSSGRLLVMDIGGGSLEMAAGIDETPDALLSLPLGAGRLTRTMLPGDPPDPADVKALRKHARATIAGRLRPFEALGDPDHAVATSKTFRQLSRLAGAPPSGDGDRVPRMLSLADVRDWVPRLAGMTTEERADLPGVSMGRAAQLVAGAVVAEAAMDLLDLEEVQVCPWALREGIILRRLDWMRGES
jgi:exopolyphosphatase/guanosine-5'-triphosphate,3'-diphosphate pyrophosphatase